MSSAIWTVSRTRTSSAAPIAFHAQACFLAANVPDEGASVTVCAFPAVRWSPDTTRLATISTKSQSPFSANSSAR